MKRSVRDSHQVSKLVLVTALTFFGLVTVASASSSSYPLFAWVQKTEEWTEPKDSSAKLENRSVQDPATTAPRLSKTVRTAEEYLAELDKSQSDGRAFFNVALPDDELNKLTAEMRRRFPMRSLAVRLAAVERSAHLDELRRLHSPRTTENNNDQFVSKTQGMRLMFRGVRAEALEALHSDSANKFITEPGFGISRMPRPSPWFYLPRNRGQLVLNTEYYSAIEFAKEPSIKLGAKLADSEAKMPEQDSMSDLHLIVVAQFASDDQNGLVLDRDQIAGFEPHAVDIVTSSSLNMEISKSSPQAKPDASETEPRWHLNRMELVGLLASDQFRVYVSESLPAMDELAKAETRPLDGFELAGLSQLFGEQNLHIAATPNRIRMLGALRAGESCLECHSVHQGDLLGALSYELIRVPRIPLTLPITPSGAGGK